MTGIDVTDKENVDWNVVSTSNTYQNDVSIGSGHEHQINNNDNNRLMSIDETPINRINRNCYPLIANNSHHHGIKYSSANSVSSSFSSDNSSPGAHRLQFNQIEPHTADVCTTKSGDVCFGCHKCSISKLSRSNEDGQNFRNKTSRLSNASTNSTKSSLNETEENIEAKIACCKTNVLQNSNKTNYGGSMESLGN